MISTWTFMKRARNKLKQSKMYWSAWKPTEANWNLPETNWSCVNHHEYGVKPLETAWNRAEAVKHRNLLKENTNLLEENTNLLEENTNLLEENKKMSASRQQFVEASRKLPASWWNRMKLHQNQTSHAESQRFTSNQGKTYKKMQKMIGDRSEHTKGHKKQQETLYLCNQMQVSIHSRLLQLVSGAFHESSCGNHAFQCILLWFRSILVDIICYRSNVESFECLRDCFARFRNNFDKFRSNFTMDSQHAGSRHRDSRFARERGLGTLASFLS